MSNTYKNKGRFFYGVLISIPAWLVHSFSVAILAAYPDLTFSVISQGMIGFPPMALVIWIPLAIIAGIIARIKGNSAAKWFVVVVLILLIVAGAAGGINLLSEAFR